jgi:hypothetical protein
MDQDVLDVLRELGCYSANVVDESPEAETGDELDELYIDIGGEG